MQEEPQAAEPRRRMALPIRMDPRNYDPRRALADPAACEKLARAPAAAFGFVAALAWNGALRQWLNPSRDSTLNTLHAPPEWAVLVKAILNRAARRMVTQSAIIAADAESML